MHEPNVVVARPPVVTVAPAGRVFLAARWHALAMLNFEVDPALVEPLVPRGAEIDLWNGRAYVSLVGFTYHETRLLGLSIPGHRHFCEVNLLFYVRRIVGGEIRRAVCFIREVVPRRAVALVARVCYNEQFVRHPMRHAWNRLELLNDGRLLGHAPSARYEWRQSGRWLGIGVECRGDAAPPVPGSHEEFIVEHYWGYSRQRDGGTLEYRVDHPSWRLWSDATPSLIGPIADFYGPQFASVLRRPPSSAFLADGSPVLVYRPQRL